MRDKCEGCPAGEPRNGKIWCFWYEQLTANGCGNHFTERPVESQRQAEKWLASLTDKEIEEYGKP